MKRYPKVPEGEWVAPRRKYYRMACCDCGLVHKFEFRLVPFINGGKVIQMRGWRDERATKRRRKADGRS